MGSRFTERPDSKSNIESDGERHSALTSDSYTCIHMHVYP